MTGRRFGAAWLAVLGACAPHDHRAPVAAVGPCPEGMSLVTPPHAEHAGRAFCIDRWEASLVEVLPGGGERPWSPYQTPEAGRELRAVSREKVVPQAYISGAQAAAACAAASKRLCSPEEWQRACLGPNDRTFGYGNVRIVGRCNDQGRSPMLALFPTWGQAPDANEGAKMNDPRLNQLAGTVSLTGSHPGCESDYGVYDMVGNLHEWTSDPKGTFQGGYWLDTHLNGDGCRYRTTAHDFVYHDYSTGFRCCADVAGR